MKEQINEAIELLKKQDVNGCITGSCLLDYFPGQDIDIFVYDIPSFNKLLFYMYYNDLFQLLDPLEKHKFDDYINNNHSSIEKLGLITIKFKYNLCVDVNVVYKKYFKTIFDVIGSFDMDIIATGFDIQTKKTLSLRESKDKVATWNKWNTNFYKKDDFWSCKRLLRQFSRVVKYTQRGYNVSEVTSKYISLIEDIINKENVYKSEKGINFHNETVQEFQTVLKILKVWEKTLTITPEELKILENMY